MELSVRHNQWNFGKAQIGETASANVEWNLHEKTRCRFHSKMADSISKWRTMADPPFSSGSCVAYLAIGNDFRPHSRQT